ncbi:MAG TPA: MtrB/PioB family outer membrane beta-barrel protein, partial [Dissulfurispiraceae bacterium]|nr:MtrB/PioB family outer membrane beta-barrel protein [Dissulfurispiraceae bacterium]
GIYGMFKLNAFSNEIIHNTTTSALTPYSGIGTNYLTTPLAGGNPSNTTPSTWNSFDYATKRSQYGGEIKVDILNPFYFNVSVSREDRRGVIPWSNGGIGGSGAIEVPAPIKYETTDYMGEIGYRSTPLYAAGTFSYGTFTNANQTLFIDGTGPLNGTIASLMSLPPDNHFYKFGFKGVLQLPLNSRFNVNLEKTYQRSSYDLAPLLNFNNAAAASGGTGGITILNSTNFAGRKDIKNYTFSLTSRPVRFVDFKLYYKYYSTENRSDTITQTISGATSGNGVFQIPLFDYKKNHYGTDLGFKLPEQFHLNMAYAYIDTNRENRLDIPSTKDSVYSAELRWDGLDFMTPKIGYERLMRLAKYGPSYDLDSNASHLNFPQFVTFDAAKQRMDTYKIAVDASPLTNLNVGAAYKYRKSAYPDNVLGVQSADTNEFEIYGDYLIGHIAKVNAYFDLQYTTQRIHDCATSSGGQCNIYADYFVAANDYSYRWDSTRHDNTYEFGAGADIYLVPKKLTLRVQYDYVNSDGLEDFGFFSSVPNQVGGVNSNAPGGPTGDPNINNIDSYHKSSFLCKLSYSVSKSFTMAVGAVFEQFKYNDFALSSPNYQYLVPGTNTFLTGAYANPSYNASIGFVSMTYRF